MIRYLTAGESHGKALIGIVEGIPAGVELKSDYINYQLWRRQQGYGRGGRMKIETDQVAILSGVRFGKTIGSPIALMIQNKDWQNWTDRMATDGDGAGIEKITIPRPGHADYAGAVKYGFDDIRNVIDRSSARETAMRVAVCSVARKLLEECGIVIGSHVLSIGAVAVKNDKKFEALITATASSELANTADTSEVRMLDKSAEKKAIEEIKNAKKAGDTLGGIFEIRVTGLPVGLGSYVHADRRLSAQLSGALMSIQAVKGVEVGDGFALAHMPGSEVHDEFILNGEKITRTTNHAGGLEGGMANGQTIVLHAAMKPISTLAHPLKSVNLATKELVESRYERSDVCAVPAASIVGEAVIAPVLANALLEKFGGDSVKEIQERYTGK
ncbi:MAG TPA: chorismate synthase [Bacteroidota bacterium]|nr:chorismate synthase [Bacteroidota bacterium]